MLSTSLFHTSILCCSCPPLFFSVACYPISLSDPACYIPLIFSCQFISPPILLQFLHLNSHRRSATIDWKPTSTLGAHEDWFQHVRGDVVTINLTGSGLSEGLDITSFYLREACMDLWNYLSAAQTDVSIVVGCPGVGKSVEVFAYAMWQAKTAQKRVTYVHTHGDGYSIVSTSDGNMRAGRLRSFTGPEILLEFIELALERQKVDMIVLDGQLQWLIKSVYPSLGRFPGVRFISCTSFQAFTKVPTETAAHAPEWSQFVMDSWTLEEYHDAFDKGALVLADPTLTDVDEMFFYAGGSFRMMKWPPQRVVRTLNSKIMEVPLKSDIIEARGIGDGSKAAVNTLMGISRGTSFLLSRYVLTSLCASVSNQHIATLRALFVNNPLWQGWVTELEVLTLIQKQRSIVFRKPSGEEEEWCQRGSVATPLSTFFDASDLRSTTLDGDWFLPERYNQECFDALFRVSPDCFRAIQITNAGEHSCKLKYLIPFVTAMNVHIIELVYVCRRSNFVDFKVPAPGQLLGSSQVARDEHHQFRKLMTTVTGIWKAKTELSDADDIPAPTVIIRHVSYECKDVGSPLSETR